MVVSGDADIAEFCSSHDKAVNDNAANFIDSCVNAGHFANAGIVWL
jgi:hypothetical protein